MKPEFVKQFTDAINHFSEEEKSELRFTIAYLAATDDASFFKVRACFETEISAIVGKKAMEIFEGLLSRPQLVLFRMQKHVKVLPLSSLVDKEDPSTGNTRKALSGKESKALKNNTYFIRESSSESESDKFTLTYKQNNIIKNTRLIPDNSGSGFRAGIGRDIHYKSLQDYETKKALFPASNGMQKNFTTRTSLKFASKEEAEKMLSKFRKPWETSETLHLLPLHCKGKKIEFHLSHRELKALGSFSKTFSALFGSGLNDLKTVFEEYYNKESMKVLWDEPKTEAFLKKASDHLAHMPLSSPIVSESSVSSSPKETLMNWLTKENNEGVIIGESHFDAKPKKLLIESMQDLADAGVETLFLEFARADGQTLMDDYLFQKNCPLPPQYQAYYQGYDEMFQLPKGLDYTALLEAAKKAGIRVVGLSTEESDVSGFNKLDGNTGRERALAISYLGATLIDQEKGLGKWVALVGHTHATTCPDGNVPGLRELTGQPNLFFAVPEEEKFPSGLLKNYEPQSGQLAGGCINAYYDSTTS